MVSLEEVAHEAIEVSLGVKLGETVDSRLGSHHRSYLTASLGVQKARMQSASNCSARGFLVALNNRSASCADGQAVRYASIGVERNRRLHFHSWAEEACTLGAYPKRAKM